MGGLGNQLFQLAFHRLLRAQGRRSFLLVRESGARPGRHSRACQLMAFAPEHCVTGLAAEAIYRLALSKRAELVGRLLVRPLNLTHAVELAEIEAALDARNGYYARLLVGYFQFADVLRQEVAWQSAQMRAAMSRIAQQRLIQGSWDFERDCVMHIRRGDFRAAGFKMLGREYYIGALRQLEQRGFSGRIFTMSDDPEVAQTIGLPRPSEFIDVEDPLLGMAMFGRFRYQVLGNSTFSFWGALLGRSDSVVVYPISWPHFQGEFMRMCDRNDWVRHE